MITKYVRLRDRNQITLPAEILEGLAVKAGDYLEISRTKDNMIRVRPTELVIMNTEMSDRAEDRALAAKPTQAQRAANALKVDQILKGQGEAAEPDEMEEMIQAARDATELSEVMEAVRNATELVEKKIIENALTRARVNVGSRAAAGYKQAVSETKTGT